MDDRRAWNYLCEAWGEPLDPAHVKYLDGWIFYLWPDHDEVDFIPATDLDIWGEPWDGLKANQLPVPFERLTNENTAALRAKLNVALADYLKDIQ